MKYADKYIDLHRHLDGSVSFAMAKKLAEIQGTKLPGKNDEELMRLLSVQEKNATLDQALKCFALPCSLMQTKESLSECVRLAMEEAERDGVVYAELRWAPQLHTDCGMTQEDAVKAALEGLKRSPIKGNFILCCMRGVGNEQKNLETIEVAKKYLVRDGGVVAVDLAGAENIFPSSDYRELFKKVKNDGLPFTFHAGEADGPSSVWCALEYGADRIGHGYRSKEDPKLLDRLAEIGIPLEMCPTSNKITNFISDMSSYPLIDFMNRGIKVTLNSDDPYILHTTLSNEFRVMEKECGLTPEQEHILLENSIDAAFTDEKGKEEIRKLVF